MKEIATQKPNFSARVESSDSEQTFRSPDLQTKHWIVQPGSSVKYLNKDFHTLSLYLHGGTRNFRLDEQCSKGAPGRICLMAQGQESDWAINGAVDFVHLYLTDDKVKQCAAINFDMDARFVELQDLLFVDDQRLKELIATLYTSATNNLVLPLRVEESSNELIFYLLTQYNAFKVSDVPINGGLSPIDRRKIRSYIHENISTKCSVNDMARCLNLSPFHFSRMFKLSFGVSPAMCVTGVRIDKIKRELQTSKSIPDIALECGFSHQSHMTQFFKKMTYYTPLKYRVACR